MTKRNVENLPDIEFPAPNTAKVYLPKVTLMYSYETVVGFTSPDHGRVFTSEHYSNTTARHIKSVFNAQPEERVPDAEFEKKLAEALSRVFA